MRRFALILMLFLAAVSCAVAQIPNRFLPPQITGKSLLEAVEVTATTSMSVGGFPVTTSGSGDYVTTDTPQDIVAKKTFRENQDFIFGAGQKITVIGSGTHPFGCIQIDATALSGPSASKYGMVILKNNTAGVGLMVQTTDPTAAGSGSCIRLVNYSGVGISAVNYVGSAGNFTTTSGVAITSDGGMYGLAQDINGDVEHAGDYELSGDLNIYSGSLWLNGPSEYLGLYNNSRMTIDPGTGAGLTGDLLYLRHRGSVGHAALKIDVSNNQGYGIHVNNAVPNGYSSIFAEGQTNNTRGIIQGHTLSYGASPAVAGWDESTSDGVYPSAALYGESYLGRAVRGRQGGSSMAGNLRGPALEMLRIGNLNGHNTGGNPLALLEEDLDDGGVPVTNADTTLRLSWLNGLHSGGKSFITFNYESPALDANDYLIKHEDRSDFYWDLAGNLSTPGVVSAKSLTLTTSTTPSAPTSSATFFVDVNNTPSIINSDGTTSALISEFHGIAAESEVSTTSTTYTTAVTLTFYVPRQSGRQLILFFEAAGSTTATTAQVRVRMNHSQVLSEQQISFAATYASNGWQSRTIMCFATAAAGMRTITVEYLTNNITRTVYMRRVRASCTRVY